MAGFVYLNKSEVDDGVSVEQLKNIIRSYVSSVYASEDTGQDLYNVLLATTVRTVAELK